jgi:putative RNA 2'-phosphotransferase
MNYSKLSKAVSHALRHEPWIYELELDPDGWVNIDQLLDALRPEEKDWLDLSIDDLHKMIALSDKKRHEIENDRIRAIYGHSIPEKIIKELATPPVKLFHGTSPASISEIMRSGLRPMKRQYVHMSVLREDAEMVGKRKTNMPVILEINSNGASKSGVKFYKGNDKIWLADSIPAEFIIKV